MEFFGHAREAVPSIVEIKDFMFAEQKRTGTVMAGLEHLDDRYLRAVGYSTKSKRGGFPKMVLLSDIAGDNADDVAKAATLSFKGAGEAILLVGETQGWLGQSLYQHIIAGKLEGAPPPVDLADELKAGQLVRTLIRTGKVKSVHDVSDGGLIVALVEMALAGGRGVDCFAYEGRLPAHAVWYGEDQGRYVVEVTPDIAEEVIERARLLALPARIVGRTGGDAIVLKGELPLPLAQLRDVREAWLPGFIGVAAA
jgi:phosphoribosylformylglycinamidine synthase